jgi:repressor LexA
MHAQTRRQREVLDFILRHIDSHGHRPSYAVIARHFGLASRAGINRIVIDLESQGLLTRRRENGHFYLEVGSNGGGGMPAGSVQVEWLEIPPGATRLEPYEERPIVLPEFMLGHHQPSRVRAFRITDDSLAADGIREDDVAIIELRKFVRDGQIVAAIVEGSVAVLRKYYRSGAYIELRPAGEHVPEDIIRLHADHIDIQGIHRTTLRPIA